MYSELGGRIRRKSSTRPASYDGRSRQYNQFKCKHKIIKKYTKGWKLVKMAFRGPSTPKYTIFIPLSTKTSSEFGGQRGRWDKNKDTERKAFYQLDKGTG